MKTGHSIRLALSKQGKTARWLAEQIGVSEAYLSTVISGKKNLTLRLVQLIEHELGELPQIQESLSLYGEANKSNYLGQGVSDLYDSVKSAKEGKAQYEVDIVIPMYSTLVHAGKTAPIYEEDKTDFNVSQHYKDTAIYHVSGDSMIDAGIEEGDRVVVKLGYRFRNRDIILCRYNGELQIKGAAIIDGVIWLFPANEHYHAWACKDGDEFTCIGTVIEIFKDPHTEWWKRIDFKTLRAEK